MLGGRTNHWGRISLRNGPYDFKPRRRDGLGFDWPINYEDVAPYYDKVEMLIGVYGDNEDWRTRPIRRPAVCCRRRSRGQRTADAAARQEARHSGRSDHRAVLTQRLDPGALPQQLHPGNPKAQRSLPSACAAAQPASGRRLRPRLLDQRELPVDHGSPAAGARDRQSRHRADAMVREVTLGRRRQGHAASSTSTRPPARSSGRRRAWSCSRRARASRCASCSIRSPRVSARARQLQRPGRQVLMDTVGAASSGQIPLLENLPPHNEDGAGGDHVYAPWWLYKEQLAGKLGFARGYHIEFGGGRHMPGMGTRPGSKRSRAAATAGSSRRMRAATTARSWASPAAAR